jgi:hypothetical protein
VDYIPREKCKEGYAYKIHSRNLSIGVFRKTLSGSSQFKSGFIGIREKIGKLFLFTEYHRDDGSPYGTVSPESEIEKCPIEDLRVDLGVICGNCKMEVTYKIDPKLAPPYPGKWIHVSESSCSDVNPGGVSNEALFDYLDQLDQRLFGKRVCFRCKEGRHGGHREFGVIVLCECDEPVCVKKEAPSP